MKPSAILDESTILLDVDSATPKSELIARLALLALGGDAPLADRVVDELLAREAKMTTGIGRGVAIPHARSPLVDRPAAALAVAPGGVDFQALDGEPVHIVFAFVTPESIPSLHLQILAQVAGLFADETLRAAVRAAATPAEILDLLRSKGA